MKIRAIFRSKWVIMAGMILLLPFLGGCQDDGLPDGNGMVVSLNQIPDNPSYTSLPLIGIKWKLVGFVDGKRNKIRMAKPEDGESFTQIFENNGRFSGRASVNLAHGEYTLTGNNLSIREYHLMTEAGEKYDGPLYIRLMEKVFAYQIFRKGLVLYYDSQKYLLFEPLE